MDTVHPDPAEAKRLKKKAYLREYQKKHRARLTEHNRKYRSKNWPIMKIKLLTKTRWKRLENPGYNHANERRWFLKKNYGMTQDEYQSMFDNQGGVCAICKQPETGNRQSRYLSVDHCHRTGKIRGLLCHGCNVSLGAMKEDVARLQAMIEYIRRHSQ